MSLVTRNSENPWIRDHYDHSSPKIVEVAPVHFGMPRATHTERAIELAELVSAIVRAGCGSTFVNAKDYDRLQLAESLGRIDTLPYESPLADLPDHLSRQIELGINYNAEAERGATASVVNLLGSKGSLSALRRCSMLMQIEEAQFHMQQLVAQGYAARARIHFAFGCPFQGDVDPKEVIELARTLHEIGFGEIVVVDNLGIATPKSAADLVYKLSQEISASDIGIRFHDTYGLALTNIHSCLPLGVGFIESCLGGVHASTNGNYPATPVATEDVVNLLNGLNIPTGLDLALTIAASMQAAAASESFPHSKTAAAWYAADCT